jgi:hypothetical protein
MKTRPVIVPTKPLRDRPPEPRPKAPPPPDDDDDDDEDDEA